MKVTRLNHPDLVLITPDVFSDLRGFFMETFHQERFQKQVAPVSFVQDNHSRSVQGALRGLHYQIKHPQGKLIRVVSGAVFDVAVDIRRSSPFFGQWSGVMLTGDNHHLLWVPPGFAHGFYVISAKADLVYKCTDFYAPAHERCIVWNDPDIAVDWPIEPGTLPVLSHKDQAGILLADAEVFA